MLEKTANVSIILPTFNRADTILRAIKSVTAQSYEDWELLIIDDGSTDETRAIDFSTIDRRIRVIRKKNAGVSAARNTGLASANGTFIAFLDSDDEWLPHYLELCVGFLSSSPDAQYVVAEFLADYTERRSLKSMFVDVYGEAARMIGSDALDLPAGESDDYLRVYETRRPLDDRARRLVPEAYRRDAHLYQGHVFEYTRWGYLGWLPTTVLTRHALEVVGGFDPKMRHAGDYAFLASLAKHFRANFISVPCARKHDRGLNSRSLRQDHLATGAGIYRFRVNRLKSFDKIHWSADGPNDRELSRIRKHYVYLTGCMALYAGMRKQALSHLRQAADLSRPFWFAGVLWAFAFVLPGKLAGFLYKASLKTWTVPQRLWHVGASTVRSVGRRIPALRLLS